MQFLLCQVFIEPKINIKPTAEQIDWAGAGELTCLSSGSTSVKGINTPVLVRLKDQASLAGDSQSHLRPQSPKEGLGLTQGDLQLQILQRMGEGAPGLGATERPGTVESWSLRP